MQGKNTKECGIKIHTHIYPLFFSLVPRKRETLLAAASWDRPARNDSKTRDCRSGGKTTGKVGFEGCRFSPKRVRRWCASRGLRGLRPEQCPPEPHRAVPALQPRCPGTAGVTPPRATRDIGGRRGQGVTIFPSCPLEEKDVFLSC